MADIYGKPADDMLTTGVLRWFQAPQEDNTTITAVAVSKDAGNNWNSGYTLLITMIFVGVGKIVTDLVITHFPLRGSGNRHAILTAYFNNGDPFSAMFLFSNYGWKLWKHDKLEANIGSIKDKPREWSTFGLVVGLFILSGGLFVGNIIIGIVVPGMLMIDNTTLARVNPKAIFYPDILSNLRNDDQSGGIEAVARVHYAACIRALGTAEYSAKALREKVLFGKNTPTVGSDGKPHLHFTYSYEISGYDMGLQRAPGLLQRVSGSCKTTYDWLLNTNKEQGIETYRPFNDPDQIYESIVSTLLPPQAWFHFNTTMNGNSLRYFNLETGIARYAIIPQVSYRPSAYKVDKDPWYITEKIAPNRLANFTVKLARPALDCNHTVIWEYGGLTTTDPFKLKDLTKTGMKLAPFYIDTVFPREFFTPVIVGIGITLGIANLGSPNQGFGSTGRIQNRQVSLADDLERLVLASYVYSREAVRNLVQLKPNIEGLKNVAATGPSDTVPDETADFVLESADVATMSVSVLITVPVVCIVLWIWIGARRKLLSLPDTEALNEGWRGRYNIRSIAFSAVHLYRMLDEELSRKRRWLYRLSNAPLAHESLSQKYTRKKAEDIEAGLEFIPTSAQIPENPGGYVHSDYAQYSYEKTTGGELVHSDFATPKIIPIHRNRRSRPSTYSFQYPQDGESGHALTPSSSIPLSPTQQHDDRPGTGSTDNPLLSPKTPSTIVSNPMENERSRLLDRESPLSPSTSRSDTLMNHWKPSTSRTLEKLVEDQHEIAMTTSWRSHLVPVDSGRLLWGDINGALDPLENLKVDLAIEE